MRADSKITAFTARPQNHRIAEAGTELVDEAGVAQLNRMMDLIWARPTLHHDVPHPRQLLADSSFYYNIVK